MSKDKIEFFSLVIALENVCKERTNNLTGVAELIKMESLISEDQFLAMRHELITTFQIGEVEPFNGKFGNEIEIGDITDAVQMTTFKLFPQSTPMDKPLALEDRVNWCNEVIKTIDRVVAFS